MKCIPLLLLTLAAPASLVPTAASAQDCEAVPAEWSGWTASAAESTTLTPGVRANLTLAAPDKVELAAMPAKPPVTGLYAGVATLDVAKAGRLRIAIGARAWIDVVRDGKALVSVAHGHGPKCSGIRKIVQFDVQPGTYTLQIVDAPASSIGVMALLP